MMKQLFFQELKQNVTRDFFQKIFSINENKNVDKNFFLDFYINI